MTQTRSAAESPGRIPRLDVLRAVAILLVFGFHYSIGLAAPFAALAAQAPKGDFNSNLNSFFRDVLLFGNSGVPLFFVISGFCIHLAFLRSRRIFQAKDFYWRRFLRIYPAYFIALAVFSVLGLFRILAPLNLKMFLTHLFLIHDFFDYRLLVSINAAFWSLAVEWQFYLLYPLVLWIRNKRDLKTCLFLALLICLLEQVACSLSPTFSHLSQEQCCVMRTLGTWCTWILGACMAESFERRELLFRSRKFWIIISLALIIAGRSYPFSFEFRFLLDSLFFAVLMEIYLAWARPLIWLERLLIPIGIISYSIYLWHLPLITPLTLFLHSRIQLPVSAWSELFFFLPLSFLILTPVFVASYWLGERALPDYLRRWRPAGVSDRSAAVLLAEVVPDKSN